jgi:hypothetical protein
MAHYSPARDHKHGYLTLAHSDERTSAARDGGTYRQKSTNSHGETLQLPINLLFADNRGEAARLVIAPDSGQLRVIH